MHNALQPQILLKNTQNKLVQLQHLFKSLFSLQYEKQ